MSLHISTSSLPLIDRTGSFPLLNPVFDFTYRNPTHALHLYDYDCQIRIASKEYSIRPGDMTCIQSGTVYGIETDTPGKHWCIHYQDSPEKKGATMTIPNYIHLGVNSLFYRQQIQLISRLSFSHDQQRGDEDLFQLEARFRLKALLLSLHNLGQKPSTYRRSRSNFSWDKLLAWVEENLDRPLSVSMLAEHANLAPGTLAKKFKQTYKTTLSQYLLNQRIDKAKSLLATTTLTIYEVGSAVGIPDPQYFNKQFRKVTGINPSRYRDENQDYLSNISDELAAKEGHWEKDSEDD